jgi:hypothetical protein
MFLQAAKSIAEMRKSIVTSDYGGIRKTGIWPRFALFAVWYGNIDNFDGRCDILEAITQEDDVSVDDFMNIHDFAYMYVVYVHFMCQMRTNMGWHQTNKFRKNVRCVTKWMKMEREDTAAVAAGDAAIATTWGPVVELQAKAGAEEDQEEGDESDGSSDSAGEFRTTFERLSNESH